MANMSTPITKRAIAQSLKDIAVEYPLSRITIKQIAEKCGVNRQTFYYHFRDIYDLVEWIYAREAARALSGRKTYATWQEGYLRIFEYVFANRQFVTRTFHSLSREHLERFLYGQTYNLLIEVIDEKAAELEISRRVRKDDKAFIAHFYKYSFVGLMLDWIDNGMKEEPQMIVDRVGTLIQGDIEKALQSFAAYPPNSLFSNTS
jgi:probable dihydroxyacetone kinase regulator